MKNFDYNSPDGNHDDSETPTKECRDCDGTEVNCDTCKGKGYVELTDAEQWNDHQARIDDEAEHANDIIYSKS